MDEDKLNRPQQGCHKKVSCKNYMILCISFILMSINLFASEDVKIIAHRGGKATGRENTLRAITNAMRQPIDGIEIDVQMTKDGVVILYHDESLKDEQGENFKISDLTYNELIKIDAEIPTLRQTLKCTKGKIPLLIEIKSYGNTSDLTKRVLKEVTAKKMLQETEICSFDPSIIREVRRLNPTSKVGLITANIPEETICNEMDFISIQFRAITPELVEKLHINGKKIYVWTVNNKKESEKMMKLKVDQIITDTPLELEII